jgi:amino acid transporter/nucleotide-binding universal stress UspA family protein
MIGAGIFVLTGIAAGVAGPALLLVFILNGFVALLTAMAYAELGSAIHGAGGGYLWIKASLPDPAGFLSGWMDWFAHAVACSLYALGFGAYFKEVLSIAGIATPALPFGTLEIWLAVLACSLFAYINFRGASETGKAGNVVTVGKIIIIGAFIVAGLWAMIHRPGWHGAFTPFMTHGWAGVFGAMGLTFIAFEGYEIIAQTSEEVESPKRNVPRAVFFSLLIVIPIYLLVALVAIGAVTPPAGMLVTEYLGQAKEIALVSAANQFVLGGGIIILVGGLLSTVSALNATIYSSSRVAFAMARDASLPRMVARVHAKKSTPHFAILFSTLLIIGMAIALPIEQVAAAAGVMFLLLFGGVNVAVIRLRKSHPELDRGFKVPFVPFTPILAIATMLFIAVFMFFQYPMAWAAAGGWIVAGVAFYYGYSRTREVAFAQRTKWMERIDRQEYSVLAAISSARTMRSLMEAAMVIARQHSGEIVVVTVAEVPEGQTLMAGRPRARELEPLLESAVDYAASRGVPVRGVLKIAHRVSEGILETAREEDCNFLLLGQPMARSLLERLVASIVERVIQDAPNQVGVVYGVLDPKRIRGVVAPVTSGANSQLAAELAPRFAEQFGATARAVTVIPQDIPDGEARSLEAAARETLEAAGVDAPLEVLRRREVGPGLVRAVEPGDLVVMGAPSTDPVAALLAETLPGVLARRGRGPIIVVRDVEAHHSGRFERFFAGRK